MAIYRTRRAALSAVVDLVDLEGSGGPLWTFLWRSTAGWGYARAAFRRPDAGETRDDGDAVQPYGRMCVMS